MRFATADDKARVRALAEQDLAARAIAERMGDGWTKGSVIGLCRRNGIPLSLSTGPRGSYGSRRGQGRPRPAPVEAPPPAPTPIRLPVAVSREPPVRFCFDGELSSTAAAVMALNDDSCRFPLGTVGSDGFAFCCQTVDRTIRHSRSYCSEHAGTCLTPAALKMFHYRPGLRS